MGFFTNIINFIKNIDIKTYIKKVIPSKQNFENLANKFRRKKKPDRTPDEEYGFTSPPTRSRQNIQAPSDNPEPIYLQVIERKSMVGIVEPTSRLEFEDPPEPQYEEPDTKKLARPSIYTDRTQMGISKLLSHLNDREQRHTIAMPMMVDKQKRPAPKKPKRISHETDDLKAYILDSINEIEMIRHQIHMKSEIVKTVDCNEADLEFVREYLTSCMMEIEDIDTKGTLEVQTAKEDALYYAKQWYDKLGAQLKAQQDATEDMYIRTTLTQLDAVKNKLHKLSSEARIKDSDNIDIIRRLSQYIDDVERVDTKAIERIETVKRATLQLAEELTEDIGDGIVNNLPRNSVEDYQISEDDIYDEVSITSSSENVSIIITDSDSDGDQNKTHQLVVPEIFIESSEVQKEAVQINTERSKLAVANSHSPLSNSLMKDATSKSINQLKDTHIKFVAVEIGNLDSSGSEDAANRDYEELKFRSQAESSSSTVHQEPPQAKESPPAKHQKKPATLHISKQEIIPVRLSKEELEFGYTQECLQEILLCRNRLECLADSVQNFRGTASGDEFVFLQDNITFSMMTLNGIDAKSIKAIQDMKREAMMYGQIWYDELELKTQEVR